MKKSGELGQANQEDFLEHDGDDNAGPETDRGGLDDPAKCQFPVGRLVLLILQTENGRRHENRRGEPAHERYGEWLPRVFAPRA